LTDPIRVLIADDQTVVREGLGLLVGLLDGMTVVGTAVDGADAVRQVEAVDPDVVLMDLHMPTLDGISATRRLTEGGARARVVVLTTYADDDALVFGALQAGARGFLTKDAGAEAIRTAIRTVVDGEAHLDPSVQRRLLEALGTGLNPMAGADPAVRANQPGTAAAPSEGPGDAVALTDREEEVLALVAEGCSNHDIAVRLVVSGATVKTHINHLLAKTGCRDRAALVVYAFHSGRARVGDR